MRKSVMTKQAKQVDKRRLTVRFWVLSGLGVGLAALLILAATAHFSWDRQQAELEQNYTTATSQLNVTLADKNLTIDSFEKSVVLLRQTSDELCNFSGLVRVYQQIVPSAGEDYRSCQQKATRLATLSAKADDLSEAIKSDQAISQVLKTTQINLAKLKPNQYQKIKSEWTKANHQLEQLAVTELLTATNKAAQAAIKDIISSYQSLMKADKDQKRPTFDNARTDLNSAYAKLRDTAKLSETAINKQVKAFVDKAV